MRVLLVGVLSVTMIGCSCPTAPQAMLESCTSKTCFYRTAASPTNELKLTPFKPDRTTTKTESKNATKTAKPISLAANPHSPSMAAKPHSPQTGGSSDKDQIASPITITHDFFVSPPRPAENSKSIVGTNVSVSALGETAELSDPVLEKAKATVASKMEYPPSVEFEDMTRAIRNSSFGPIDTICGHVRGRKTSGAETGKRPFLYLVKEDIAFVDYGYSNSVAANAYLTTCTSGNLKSAISP